MRNPFLRLLCLSSFLFVLHFSGFAQIVVVDPPIDTVSLPCPTGFLSACKYSVPLGSEFQGEISIKFATLVGLNYPIRVEWTDPVDQELYSTDIDIESQINNGTFSFPVSLSNGNYAITVTSNNGCTDACSSSACDLTAKLEQKVEPSCSNDNDGLIVVGALGATGQVSYLWLDDQNGPVRNNLPAGTYTVFLTDELQCRDTLTVTLNSQPAPDVSCIVSQNEWATYPGRKGTVRVFVNGDGPVSGNYTLSWQGDGVGAMAVTQNPIDLKLPAGSYSFELKDQNGCTDTCSAVVPWSLRVRVAPGKTKDFVIEYDTEVSATDVEAIRKKIRDQGATISDFCWYHNGTYRLELWRAVSDINLNDQGTKTPIKSDTSDIKLLLIPDTVKLPDYSSNNCAPQSVNVPGRNRVVVAVIDSGIDMPTTLHPEGHEALNGFAWRNTGEGTAPNNADNDNNGIKDDLYGYDFVSEKPNPLDDMGHGTHVGGIIAQDFPDSLIDLELMNLKVQDLSGKGNVFDLTCALHYAVDKQADIINLSLGYYADTLFRPLYNALKRADNVGIPVVVSSGNDSLWLVPPKVVVDTRSASISVGGLTWLPAKQSRWPGAFKLPGSDVTALDNLMVVAALDNTKDHIAQYSNVGIGLVDIAAPGTFEAPYLYHEMRTLSGTSMSAGLISRTLAYINGIKPGLTVTEQYRYLQLAVDRTPEMEQLLAYKGKINEIKVMAALGIDTSKYNIRAPYGALATPSSLRYDYNAPLKTPRTPMRIELRDKQSRKRTYNNIELIIVPLQQPDNILYHGYWCEADVIYWDGKIKDSSGKWVDIPQGVYFSIVKVNGSELQPPYNRVKIEKR